MLDSDRLEAEADAAIARKDFGEAQRLWREADKARDREASAAVPDWRDTVAQRVQSSAAAVLGYDPPTLL